MIPPYETSINDAQNIPDAPEQEVFVFPTSLAQQQLWFFHQVQPEDFSYSIPSAIRLVGPLHVAALEQGINEIIARHEILRTSFTLLEEEPVQVIVPLARLPLPVVDIQRCSVAERDTVIQQLVREDVAHSFDLAAGPLIRITLVRLGEQEHLLLLIVHHLVFDNWSMSIFLRELSLLYSAFSQGQPSSLPPLPLQYADFAVWQRQLLQADTLETQLAYWKHQLSGIHAGPSLSTDYPRPAHHTFCGATRSRVLPLSLVKKLAAFNHREGVTLFMTLLAALQVLLYRMTGQEDVVVSSPVSQRNRTEIEDLIGFFINTLVLRTDLSGNPSFRALLGRVREVCLGAYAHQDVPFEKLLEIGALERDVNGMPRIQIVFALQNTPPLPYEMAHIKVSTVPVESGTAKLDLHVAIEEVREGLHAKVEYNTALFKAVTIDRLLERFQVLLECIVTSPELPIAALPLLSPVERQHVLEHWNATEQADAQQMNLHQLFEAQVARVPDALALVCEGNHLTYRELNRRANQLARYLRGIGAGPEVLVGLCAERSLAFVTAWLGILKAGGVYLPLDPSYPAERLAFMLEDARVSVLITQEQWQNASLVPNETRRVSLDAVWKAAAQEKGDNLLEEPAPENAAYVIYTSGSTGRPKGTLVTYRGLRNLTYALNQAFELRPTDRVLQFASMNFDASLFEMVMTLSMGAPLYLSARGVSHPGQALADVLREQAITTVALVPSVLSALPEGDYASLTTVIAGGEVCPSELVARWVNGRRFFNVYGPTEATVWATVAECYEGTAKLAIGRPISNVQVYILDAHLEPVPIGFPGELYIGGVGVARGYINRADLTAERFLPHPFSKEGGERVYRTGDRARYLSDGAIEFLGRIDQQVKIRGFRIELQEIEAVLELCPSVQSAVLLARENDAGQQHLVAYIVPDEGTHVLPDTLRAFLKERLPDYMIPALFLFIHALPLTPNGKLDRQALPEPESTRPELETAFVVPGTPAEHALAEIWAQVLEVERVGIHDDFFDLGGDSMLSIQMLAMAQEKGLEISFQQLFQYKTIHQIVQVIDGAASGPSASRTKQPFQLIAPGDRQRIPEGVEDAYPLTMLQAGMIFHDEQSPDAVLYHDIGSFHMHAPYDLQQLHTALQQLIRRHSILRTSFDLHSFTELLQLVHREVHVPLWEEDLRALTPEEQEQILADWLETEKQRKFVWTQVPLLRVKVHRMGETSFQITLTKHHAILDGWSAASLFAEWTADYMSLIEGNAVSSTRALASTFRDFVVLEQEALASTEMRDYWMQKLADSTSTILPRWKIQRQGKEDLPLSTVHIPIALDVSQGLKRLAHMASVPLKTVLLAVHLRVLALWSGQTDILTGLVTNGRPETEDGERVLGLFLNTLPHRQQLGGGSWMNLIRATFEAEKDSLPARRYPLAQIQQDQGGGQLFETMFNYVHFHVLEKMRKLSGLRVLKETIFGQTNYTLAAEFNLDITTSQVEGSLVYHPGELAHEQVQAMSGYYARALVAMVNEPGARYETAVLLSEDEQRQLLRVWNETARVFAEPATSVQRFEAIAEHYPDAVALVFEENQVTYQALNVMANQCAHLLQRLGTGPEVRVGLCMERSLGALIALLGILKARGAYVPLDPEFPQERLAVLLNDAQVTVVVTQSTLARQPFLQDIRCVCLDTEWLSIATESTENLPGSIHSCSSAYILHTSGSTGTPKGIVVEHHQLFNYTCSMIERLSLTPGSRFALFHSLSVDFSLTMLFPVLCSGGCLHVVAHEKATDPQALGDYVQSRGIDCLKITPSHLAALQSDSHFQNLLPRRLLILGGEPSRWEWVQSLQVMNPQCAILNHYGPTETTVGVLTYALPSSDEALVGSMIPVGSPLANSRAYILDDAMQLAPVGTPGGLYIGGANVSRGYLNSPHMTAASFLPDPFDGQGGGRLYKTGDQARYLPNGVIEFLGRLDDQVKVHGYRVELNEITAALRSHPAVKDALVLAQAHHMRDAYLVAYTVLDTRQEPTVQDLHMYLRKRLPTYMVPTAFLFMSALPLTPAGKVDRRVLPLPDPEERPPLSSTTYVPPRTHVEHVLADIWAEVLKVARVGIHDDFFTAGGHSLLAIQIMSRIRATFQIEIPLRSLFENPSLAGLARAIEQLLPPETEEERLARLLEEIESLSDDEARKALEMRAASEE